MTSADPVYLEALLLSTLDARERGMAIGRALTTPCQAAEDGLDSAERLRFWAAVIAYALGIAEGSVGAVGRAAIIQCMRNVPASAERVGMAQRDANTSLQ